MSKKNQSISSIRLKNFLKSNSILLGFLAFVVIIGGVVMLNANKEEVSYVFGDDVIDVYYFHLSTCPHCHKQNEFHSELREMYPELRINEYEIKSQFSQDEYKKFAAEIGGVDPVRISTPTTFIGNRSNVGFGTVDTTGQILIDMIEDEKARIEANWNPETMITTQDLRATLAEE